MQVNKKGQANPLNFGVGLVIGFVVLFIVAVLGINVLANLRGTFTAGTTEFNAANNSVVGLSKLTDQATTIGVVIAVVIVLLLVLGVFAFRGRR